MTSPMTMVVLLAAVGAALILGLSAVSRARRRKVGGEQGGRGARRLAELLLMEISLYHTNRLADAREEKRILVTFEEELARARRTFEERFPPGSPGWEQFDLEVVRTLAHGDGQALGPPPASSFRR